MAKVQQYQPNQVQTQVVGGPTAQNAPAAAFGGDVAKGGMDLAKAGFQMKQRIDTTAAEEALVQFERDKNEVFFNPETGFFNKAGRDAYDNAPAASKALEDLKKQYGEKLNQGARILFNKSADAHITRGAADISRHSAKQFQAWEISTIEAQVENTVENASLYWNDPDALKIQRALGRQAIMDASKIAGESPEATNEKLQTYDSAFALNTIGAATQSSAAEGTDALEKHGDMLEGPDKVKMQKAIETKTRTEKILADANEAVLTATRLVDQYETRAEIIEEVNKEPDPELRKKKMTEAMSQFTRKETAKTEIQTEYYNQGIEHFNNKGTAEEFKTAYPEAWDGMSEKHRNNLLTGKHITTDQIEFNNLLSLPRNELAKVNPAEYSHIFRPADVSKLRSAVDKAKKGQTYTQLQSPGAKATKIATNFFGKKASWKGKKAEQVNAFLEEAQSRVQVAEDKKGASLDPGEIDEIMNDYSREFAVQRSNFGFDMLAFDDVFNLKNTDPAKLGQLSQYVELHGEDSFAQVNSRLQEIGVELTIDNFLKAYEQVTE
jgi:hypothetical protein